ncbi:MAG: glycoside hydrolase family 15 protein, partial [Gammaproteobacteria bacterium]
AIPWGESSSSRGGYHVVWPRDLVESAGALGFSGAVDDARDVLRYLIATQQEDGHWLQNQWLGGKPFWEGVQLDETAFPVLLAGALADYGTLENIPVVDMVRRALAFLVANGPSSSQDRWEEDAGINGFTLAVMIAALVEGAQFLAEPDRSIALMIADTWNARIEDWTWTEGSDLAKRLGVAGYYLRIAPADVLTREDAKSEDLLIKNRSYDNHLAADDQIATDFLQLVRYGLRRADDPKIVESVRAIDQLLRTDTPNGPVWHRYNNDGYGEHRDGRPFDGTGHGRGWPLLTGERGHYALVAGEDPLPYLEAMAAMTGPGGMIPEQVWDSDPIPERGLYPGQPSGSAMPLVWAHAEFIKLAVSREQGKPCDRPPRVWERYKGERPEIDWRLWALNYRPRSIPSAHTLRIMLPAAATIHWGVNGWQKIHDTATREAGLGMHLADLPTKKLTPGSTVEMTFRWHDSDAWQGEDFRIEITGG